MSNAGSNLPKSAKIFKMTCGKNEIFLRNYSMQDVISYLDYDVYGSREMIELKKLRDELQKRNTELVEKNRKLEQKLEEIIGMYSKLVKTKPGIII